MKKIDRWLANKIISRLRQVTCGCTRRQATEEANKRWAAFYQAKSIADA